jgi:hypothetical protein
MRLLLYFEYWWRRDEESRLIAIPGSVYLFLCIPFLSCGLASKGWKERAENGDNRPAPARTQPQTNALLQPLKRSRKALARLAKPACSATKVGDSVPGFHLRPRHSESPPTTFLPLSQATDHQLDNVYRIFDNVKPACSMPYLKYST